MNPPSSLPPQTRVAPRLYLFALALGFCGCEAQRSNDYLGEALFDMHGSVKLEKLTAVELVPALALVNLADQTLHFVDTEVTGEFPANFRMKVFVPPPAAALGGYPHEDLPGEPRHAVGRIAAVSPDHAPMLYLVGSIVNQLVPNEACECVQEPCTPCTENQFCGPDSCTFRSDLWAFDKVHMASITYSCPRERLDAARNAALDPQTGQPLEPIDPLDCQVVSKSGDPLLPNMPVPEYAGFSRDYVLLYLEAPAPADGFTAHRFGSPGGLAAGYHLLAARRFNEDEISAAQECSDRALQLGTDEYNAQHDTNYGPSTNFSCSPENGIHCGLTPEQLGMRGAWYRARAKLGCAEWMYEYTPVADPTATPITVHVGPDEAFVF